MPEKIFLLGGYDLEMLTIRALLEKYHIRYFDKKLNWTNAFLSAYVEVLSSYAHTTDVTIYGVELQEKNITNIPDNYVRIDHHNDYNYLPSALEQTAAILDVQLDEEQQLIAANDKGYIPAMQALGATEEQIERIRLLDRKAQGVTETDELLADEALKSKTIQNGITIVKSKSNRFSPITDRLYPYQKLLIYTDDELMYYGVGKASLVSYFKDEIAVGKMFHGGGNTGFIGTVKSVFLKGEITELKNKIIQMVQSNI